MVMVGNSCPNIPSELFDILPIGLYDTQYAERGGPDCRGRLRTDKDGKYGYRAVVPVSYAVPSDVSQTLCSMWPFSPGFVE